MKGIVSRFYGKGLDRPGSLGTMLDISVANPPY